MEERFCGVWGNLREEYLKAKEPALYNSLQKNGEREDYLESYQLAYSNRADRMARELAEARGVNDELYQQDSIRWLIESEKIQEEIKARLEKEIQQ
ncbi:MAG: TnpV protein [Selenomonadaceae bacterium]|nr:TnpV protein [Selenomonadaceae bacterium]